MTASRFPVISIVLLLLISHAFATSETLQTQTTESETQTISEAQTQQDPQPATNLVTREVKGGPSIVMSSDNRIKEIKYKKAVVVDYTMTNAMNKLQEESKRIAAAEAVKFKNEQISKQRELAFKQSELDNQGRTWDEGLQKKASKDAEENREEAKKAAADTEKMRDEQKNKYIDQKTATQKQEETTKSVLKEAQEKTKAVAEAAEKKLTEEKTKYAEQDEKSAIETKNKNQMAAEEITKSEQDKKQSEQQNKQDEETAKQKATQNEQAQKQNINKKEEDQKNEINSAEQKQKQNEQAEKDAHKKKEEAHKEDAEKARKQRQEATDKRAAQEQAAKTAAEDEDKKAIIQAEPSQLTKGKAVKQASELPFTGAYTYMFWVQPQGIIGEWANIIHKGQENLNRNPAIWFYPGQLRLHVRSGVQNNPTYWNGWQNAGCDPGRQLPTGVWTHVAVTHRGGVMRVYINGNNECETGMYPPVQNPGPLYAADPWHQPASAMIGDLRHYPKWMEEYEVQRVMSQKKF